MRILSVIASLAESGGAEMLVCNLTLEFTSRGHVCHVVYIADARSLGASEAFERAFKEQLSAAGITFEALGADCRKNPLKGGLRLRRIARRFRPDIIHHHLAWGLLFQQFGLIGSPTVYTHHNIRLKFPPWTFRLFDRFVDRYVAICDACARLLKPHVGRPIALIPNGVPRSFARAEPRATLPRDVEVLSVGTLRTEKHYENLIGAAARLVPLFRDGGRRIRFSIAGEGTERSALEQEIAARGMNGHVELLGTRSDIASLMGAADLLVLSSRSEGLPITLIEATMSSLPIVTTDVGGCADVVEDGQSGYVVPPERSDLLADAIGRILADEARYVAFSARAQEVGEGFTLHACADAHLRLYEDVLAERRRPASTS